MHKSHPAAPRAAGEGGSGGGDAATPHQPPPSAAGPSMPPTLSSQAVPMAASSLQQEEPAAGEGAELAKWAQQYKHQVSGAGLRQRFALPRQPTALTASSLAH